VRLSVLSNVDLGIRLADLSVRRLDMLVELAEQICLVPAPTGAEGARGQFVANMLRERGYDPELGPEGNVYAQRPGYGNGLLLISAHLDTVFPAGTELTVRRDGQRLFGPGIGDNSLGIAAAIMLFDILDQAQMDTYPEIVLVADVGEEGLGNLVGMQAALDRYGKEISAVIAIEGHNLGRITNVAVGSKRWRVNVQGPGGHSWGAYGQPSAIHTLCEIVQAWCALKLPRKPRTTLNIGSISGGTSVNTIAAWAEALVDMRSTDARQLDELAERLHSIANDFGSRNVRVKIEVLGERPAGELAGDHALLDAARQAAREAGVTAVLDASSTSVNIPLAEGIPGICVGITTGGRGHTLEEFINVQPAARGLHQLTSLVLACSDRMRDGVLETGSRA
jgi:acetylornithine deacetylase/succinyl-diaminopimelate desuccinylase-like protein